MKRPLFYLALFALLLGHVGLSGAAMILTADGMAAGFTLSTYAFNFPTSGCCGPIGIGFPATGGVLVSDYGSGRFYRLPDADGQNIASTLPTGTAFAPQDIAGLARGAITNSMYVARQQNSTGQLGGVTQVLDDGTFVAQIVPVGSPGTSIPNATGIIALPNGHLMVSSPGQRLLTDVNPLVPGGSPTVFSTNYDFDGMATDGTILYGASCCGDAKADHILGVRLSDGVQVYDSGLLPFSIDGLALGTGSLSDRIFTNTNNGQVFEASLTGGPLVQITTGGSRGDFVSVDPSNCSLLLTQTDSVLRLTAPSGGGFCTRSTVPEPATLSLLALGIAGLGFSRRKQA